jgi:hypothetical protein
MNVEPTPGFEPGDLFLTKWSLDPGEFELISALSSDRGRDHLPMPWALTAAPRFVCPSKDSCPPLSRSRRDRGE